MIGLDSADVIDDLTHMLQLFKHKTCYLQRLLHRLVHEYFDQREILETKAHLSTLFDEEIELVEQLHRYSRPLKMILYRFFSRIVEVINNDRPRLREKLYNPITQYYKQVESIVYQVVSDPQGDYLQAMQALYEKSRQLAAAAIELLEEEGRKHIVRRPKEEVRYSPKLENPEKQTKSLIRMLPVLEPPSPAPTKPSIVQQGLRVLDCLDIDSNHYRSNFLYCKHHDQAVEQDCLERNELIQADISQFRKKYLEWQMRKTRSISRARRLSNLKEQSPLRAAPQSLPQTPMPWRKREHSSLNKLEAKQNKYDRTISGGFYKTPPKPNLSPKKVLLCFNKLSLKPLEETKYVPHSSQKKRCRVRGSSRRAGDSLDMWVEGQKIRDLETRRSELRLLATNDRTFASNLFHS